MQTFRNFTANLDRAKQVLFFRGAFYFASLCSAGLLSLPFIAYSMTRKNQKILNTRKQIKILGTINFVDMPSKAMTEQELELEQIKSDNDYADYLNKSTISFRIF